MKNKKLIFIILIGLGVIISLVFLSDYFNTLSCDYDSETKKYVGKGPRGCVAIRYVCEPGEDYFSDECGCGCEIVSPPDNN